MKMSIAKNIENIQNELPPSVLLVAISKYKPVEDIKEAYSCGLRAFGESKAQEMLAKYEQLPSDIEWHFIGHLQTNKVKYIAPFVHLIHGVDSLKLLKAINKEAEKNNRVIDCLLQFHVAKEDTKFGLNFNEATELLNSQEFISMNNVRVVGIMGMASYSSDAQLILNEFAHLKQIFEQLKQLYFSKNNTFKELSMGMSGDYKYAIEEGSTMIRVGSAIFGNRN